MKHQNQKVYLGLGIGGLLALGLGIYFSRRGGSQENIQEIQNLDKVTVLQILKELRKELFSVFTNFSMVSMQIKNQSQGRVKPEEIKMMLLEQPMFKDEINTVEQQIYSKFGITKENFQSICEASYADDQDIQAIQQDMKQSFDKSFQGIAPDPKSDIPEFLTPAMTIQILKKVMTEGAVKLNEKLLELMESGEQIDFNNPKLMQVMSDLKMDSQKKDILIEYGLDKYEQSAQQILQYATQVYQSTNKDRFNDQLRNIEQNYQGLMEQLLTQGPIVEAQVRNLMARNTQPPSNPFSGMGQFSGSRSQDIFPEETKANSSLKIEQQQKVQQQNDLQKNTEAQVKLDKVTIIQILKELKNALFPILQNFSILSNQIKAQYQGKVRPEEIKMMILEQPMFQNEIDNAEQTVFNQFKLTKKAFLQICQSDYGSDQEIQSIQSEMKQAFENSFAGIAADSKCTIPEFLTAAITLEILTRVMTEGAVLLNDKLLELMESGEQLDFNNPKLMSILSELKSDTQKKDLLNEYGLNKYEQPAQQILQYATQFYSDNSEKNQDGFLEQLRIVQTNYQGLVQQLLTQGPMIGNQVKIIMARNTKSISPKQQQQEKKEVVVQEVQEVKEVKEIEQNPPQIEIVQQQKDEIVHQQKDNIVVAEQFAEEKKEVVNQDAELNTGHIVQKDEIAVGNQQQVEQKQEIFQEKSVVDDHNHSEEKIQ